MSEEVDYVPFREVVEEDDEIIEEYEDYNFDKIIEDDKIISWNPLCDLLSIIN